MRSIFGIGPFGFGLGWSGGGVRDPLASVTSFRLRLQTYNSGATPIGLYTDTGCTTPATADGDLVAGVKDAFGSLGIMATQATSASRPTLKIISGEPVLRFDGVDDILTGTLPSAGTALIFRAKASVIGGGVYSDGAGSHHPFSDGSIYENFGATVRVDGVDPVDAMTDWHVYSARNVAGTHTIKVNGVSRSSIARAASTATAFKIGHANQTGVDPGDYAGDVTHIYVCDAADADTVETYLLSITDLPGGFLDIGDGTGIDVGDGSTLGI